ncbi:putative cruciform dna recognition protein [Rhypophila decipiens]|uniref:Cruciform dna recognition protein n=1 Tax=Rhypophila decipiens TaxID=261697 RepID=A0AAN6YJC6_9PEZI|nr:putative cruciform dna recognition protein [Rhypophila decipiens]
MSSTNDNTSTLQSYVDSAKGAAQNLVGSVLGTSGDQAEGKAKQEKADAEYDASHATAKLGPVTVTTSGVTKDHPDRSAGSWNQTVGSAKEAAGGLVGSESLKQSGREQNREGQEQEAAGQVSDLASGTADRVTGTVGSAVAGLTGDRAKKAEYQKQHDTGKTQQRGVEHDLNKEAEARKAEAEKKVSE